MSSKLDWSFSMLFLSVFLRLLLLTLEKGSVFQIELPIASPSLMPIKLMTEKDSKMSLLMRTDWVIWTV